MGEYILVSGGSGGLGREICRAVAAVGRVPIVGYATGQAGAVELAAELGGLAMELDLMDDASIDDALRALKDGGVVVAGLVLAASPPPAIAPLFRLPDGEIAKQWTVNVLGAHRLAGAVIKAFMKPGKRGWIAAVLSEAMGLDGVAAKSMGGYIIAKYGLLGLMKVLESEYAWLDVHLISPSYMETSMLDVFDHRFLDQMRKDRPGERFDAPEDVARALVAKVGLTA